MKPKHVACVYGQDVYFWDGIYDVPSYEEAFLTLREALDFIHYHEVSDAALRA